MSTFIEMHQDDVTGAVYPPTPPNLATQEVDHHTQRLHEALMRMLAFLDEGAEVDDAFVDRLEQTNVRAYSLRAVVSLDWIRRTNIELAEWWRQEAAKHA